MRAPPPAVPARNDHRINRRAEPCGRAASRSRWLAPARRSRLQSGSGWEGSIMKKYTAAVLLALASLNGAQAQDYPDRTVTIIVPFAAGGPADVTGRIVADIFSRHLKQQFVVENVGGAGGTLGSLRAAKATPDGYTIISGHMGTHAAAPFFYPNLGYDPEKDFEPIGLIA